MELIPEPLSQRSIWARYLRQRVLPGRFLEIWPLSADSDLKG
jgi:hypothetical protein